MQTETASVTEIHCETPPQAHVLLVHHTHNYIPSAKAEQHNTPIMLGMFLLPHTYSAPGERPTGGDVVLHKTI